MRIAVTVEQESWILRRLAERFMAEVTGCEIVPVPMHEPIPAGVDAALYCDWPHYLLQPAGIRRKVPSVLMVHHIDRFAFRLRLIMLRRDVQMSCMAERWVRFFRRWTFPSSRVTLAHYGVDLDAFRPPETLSFGAKTCIGVVGRLYPGGRKGEDRLVAIARRLAPEKFSFQFMGERWDNVVAELRQMGFDVAMAERCAEHEQPAHFQRMDSLLVCSRNEGGPLPALEALASGTPVISTDVGFVPDLKERVPFAVNIFGAEAEAAAFLEDSRQRKQEAFERKSELTAGVRPYSWSNWAGEMKVLAARAASRK